MPDLISHTVVASFLRPLLRKKFDISLILIGAILPDLIARASYVLVPSHLNIYFSLTHTPFIIFLEIL